VDDHVMIGRFIALSLTRIQRSSWISLREGIWILTPPLVCADQNTMLCRVFVQIVEGGMSLDDL